jgi:hypothetical protein
MTFSKDWIYETSPTDSDYIKDIDDYIRGLATAIRERLTVDHAFYANEGGATDVGMHRQVTFLNVSSPPSSNNQGARVYYAPSDGRLRIVYPDGTNKKIPDERDIPEGGSGGGTSEFPPGTILYFYQASPPPGWEIVSGVGDCVLAVKGGSTYLTAGAITGTWSLSVSGTASGTTSSSTDLSLPNHKHRLGVSGMFLKYDNENPLFRIDFTQSSSGYPFRWYSFPNDSGDAGSAQPHVHFVNLSVTASTGSWRPRAAVGILARKL